MIAGSRHLFSVIATNFCDCVVQPPKDLHSPLGRNWALLFLSASQHPSQLMGTPFLYVQEWF